MPEGLLIRTTTWCVMFYCLKGGYTLKKTQWKWLHEVSYLFFFSDFHIQCAQFLSQKRILRSCWGPPFSPGSGNPAVLSVFYIITVIKNLLWVVGKTLDGVRGRGNSGPPPFQPIFLLISLQIRLGSLGEQSCYVTHCHTPLKELSAELSFQYGPSRSLENDTKSL